MSDKNTAIVETGLGRLLQQFEGSVLFRELCSSYLRQAQAFEDAIWPLLGERGIDNMTGHRLDGLGQIVKFYRAGRNDTDYRLALKGELAILQSDGTIEDILEIAQLLIQMGTADYFLSEYFPKTVYLRPINHILLQDPVFIASMLRRAVSAATQFLFVYGLSLDSALFTLSTSPTASGSSTTLGLANDGQTTGGHLAGAA